MAETIWETSVTSTAFLQDAKFSVLPKRECSLEYFYEDKDYSAFFEKLIFGGVESFKCTYYLACSLEMIAAYCKVVDVGNSAWLSETKQNLSGAGENPKNLKHLRIYFDDGPCYKFICKSFQVTNEEQKSYFVNPNQPVK